MISSLANLFSSTNLTKSQILDNHKWGEMEMRKTAATGIQGASETNKSDSSAAPSLWQTLNPGACQEDKSDMMNGEAQKCVQLLVGENAKNPITLRQSCSHCLNDTGCMERGQCFQDSRNDNQLVDVEGQVAEELDANCNEPSKACLCCQKHDVADNGNFHLSKEIKEDTELAEEHSLSRKRGHRGLPPPSSTDRLLSPMEFRLSASSCSSISSCSDFETDVSPELHLHCSQDNVGMINILSPDVQQQPHIVPLDDEMNTEFLGSQVKQMRDTMMPCSPDEGYPSGHCSQSSSFPELAEDEALENGELLDSLAGSPEEVNEVNIHSSSGMSSSGASPCSDQECSPRTSNSKIQVQCPDSSKCFFDYQTQVQPLSGFLDTSKNTPKNVTVKNSSCELLQWNDIRSKMEMLVSEDKSGNMSQSGRTSLDFSSSSCTETTSKTNNGADPGTVQSKNIHNWEKELDPNSNMVSKNHSLRNVDRSALTLDFNPQQPQCIAADVDSERKLAVTDPWACWADVLGGKEDDKDEEKSSVLKPIGGYVDRLLGQRPPLLDCCTGSCEKRKNVTSFHEMARRRKRASNQNSLNNERADWLIIFSPDTEFPPKSFSTGLGGFDQATVEESLQKCSDQGGSKVTTFKELRYKSKQPHSTANTSGLTLSDKNERESLAHLNSSNQGLNSLPPNNWMSSQSKTENDSIPLCLEPKTCTNFQKPPAGLYSQSQSQSPLVRKPSRSTLQPIAEGVGEGDVNPVKIGTSTSENSFLASGCDPLVNRGTADGARSKDHSATGTAPILPQQLSPYFLHQYQSNVSLSSLPCRHQRLLFRHHLASTGSQLLFGTDSDPELQVLGPRPFLYYGQLGEALFGATTPPFDLFSPDDPLFLPPTPPRLSPVGAYSPPLRSSLPILGSDLASLCQPMFPRSCTLPSLKTVHLSSPDPSSAQDRTVCRDATEGSHPEMSGEGQGTWASVSPSSTRSCKQPAVRSLSFAGSLQAGDAWMAQYAGTSLLEQEVCLQQKRALVGAVSAAVEEIVSHFSSSRTLVQKAQSGDSRLNPSLARVVLQSLCPALRCLLSDGLKPYLSDIIVGRRKNSPWGLVEASTQPGPCTQALYSLYCRLGQLPQLCNSTKKFNAFIFGLLNLKLLDFWISHLQGCEDVLSIHYNTSSFLRLSYSSCEHLFEELLLLLQPLSVLTFHLDLLFEHHHLETAALPPANQSVQRAISSSCLPSSANSVTQVPNGKAVTKLECHNLNVTNLVPCRERSLNKSVLPNVEHKRNCIAIGNSADVVDHISSGAGFAKHQEKKEHPANQCNSTGEVNQMPTGLTNQEITEKEKVSQMPANMVEKSDWQRASFQTEKPVSNKAGQAIQRSWNQLMQLGGKLGQNWSGKNHDDKATTEKDGTEREDSWWGQLSQSSKVYLSPAQNNSFLAKWSRGKCSSKVSQTISVGNSLNTHPKHDDISVTQLYNNTVPVSVTDQSGFGHSQPTEAPATNLADSNNCISGESPVWRLGRLFGASVSSKVLTQVDLKGAHQKIRRPSSWLAPNLSVFNRFLGGASLEQTEWLNSAQANMQSSKTAEEETKPSRAVRAICDHEGSGEELSITKGEVLIVVEGVDEEWIRCQQGDQMGLVQIGYTSLIM
ncbi:uncharacterized protein rusc1 isoform X1 [Polypterus senegalus]|nr:uncharacterized protein rusc1 isoform X1 [Polypterus senegalus]XP_039623183.1 uncharacterized protein rusc1 isoform X1 [Polypterus senegalus]